MVPQVLELPHASVEAVVDILMKTDLSPSGIEALEAAARSHNRSVQPAVQPGMHAKNSIFPGPGMQNGTHAPPPQQQFHNGQQPPFGSMPPAMNHPANGSSP